MNIKRQESGICQSLHLIYCFIVRIILLLNGLLLCKPNVVIQCRHVVSRCVSVSFSKLPLPNGMLILKMIQFTTFAEWQQNDCHNELFCNLPEGLRGQRNSTSIWEDLERKYDTYFHLNVLSYIIHYKNTINL